jgi:DUF1680 family protein
MTTSRPFGPPGRPVAATLGATTAPVVPSRGRLRPLGLSEVQISGGFWGNRQAVNASATLRHCRSWMERLGWIGNFRAAAEGRLARDRQGREFSDSEVYKLAEAIAWESMRSGGAHVGAGFDDDLAEQIAAAQHPDGYLNTAFGHAGQPGRYTDLKWGHELYCYGHLIQAAVAHARARGDNELTRIGLRAADHVCETFGTHGNPGICGHPGIEMALVELARLSGEQRYLDQATLFVDRRGRGLLSDAETEPSYFQDDVPVRDARVLRGHAVRALYLAAGAVDVAIETGDDALLAAVIAQWEATVARRTYLTGGMGARHSDEAFGDDFELPPDRAYAETCAAVASVMLSWRLLLATGEPRYADLIERTLFNAVAASPASDGRAFFYANRLHQRTRGLTPPPDAVSPRPLSALRAPWYAVSCCPNNVARTMASLAAYFVTADASGLQIHQYADAEVRTTLDDGRAVGVAMRTAYPESGSVTVRITHGDPRPWTLSLRVPSWAVDGGELVEPDGRRRRVRPGVVDLTRAFAVGDEVRLELPIAPRWVMADPRVDAVRGTLAVERGPVVLCVESVDLPRGVEVDAVRVDPKSPPAERDGHVLVTGELRRGASNPWPYYSIGTATAGAATTRVHQEAEIPLVPYHSWANRGPSTMRVWIPTTDSGA